ILDELVDPIHDLALVEDMMLCLRLPGAAEQLVQRQHGVLLYGHARNAYWYGSQLSIEETRRLAPYQNATGLQVTSAVLAGMVWALENPDRGVVEADEMDFRRCLEVQRPYLGPVVGRYTDWTPLKDRGVLFPEDVDHDDPWQFKNVIVR